MALSTSAMLLLDQRTLQIKYRIPATEIYRLSLSPFHDNIAVFHVKAVSKPIFSDSNIKIISFIQMILVGSGSQKRRFRFSNSTRHRSDNQTISGCSECHRSTAGSLHRSRVRTHYPLRCTVFNCSDFVGRFEATFGNQTVVLSFICSGTSNSHSSPMKITRKNDRMEIIV